MSTKVITGKCRASYLTVFKSRIDDFGNEKFSVALLIPKSDKGTIHKVKQAIKDAVFAKWGKKPPSGWKNPLHDGDGEKPNGGEYPPEYADNYVVNAKSDDAPSVVDKDLNEIIDPREFISGDYCRASINAYSFDRKGNKGVAFGLNNIQLLAKGDPLSGRSRPEDDFEAYLEDDSGEDLFGEDDS